MYWRREWLATARNVLLVDTELTLSKNSHYLLLKYGHGKFVNTVWSASWRDATASLSLSLHMMQAASSNCTPAVVAARSQQLRPYTLRWPHGTVTRSSQRSQWTANVQVLSHDVMPSHTLYDCRHIKYCNSLCNLHAVWVVRLLNWRLFFGEAFRYFVGISM